MQGEKIIIDGCDNLRQLGGYWSTDNRQVRPHIFYRGGALYNLKKPECIEQFMQLGIKTILDLRSEQERISAPDPAFDGINNIAHSALTAMDNSDINFDLSTLLQTGTSQLLTVSNFVAQGYRDMPFGNPAYKAMFAMLLTNQTPIYFHCTAGKDRTGIAAALILATLGVPYQTIQQDFLITNTARLDTIDKMIEKYSPILLSVEPNADLKNIFSQIAGVTAPNLDASFEEIEKRYSSFDNYLLHEFDIDAEKHEFLKNTYLV